MKVPYIYLIYTLIIIKLHILFTLETDIYTLLLIRDIEYVGSFRINIILRGFSGLDLVTPGYYLFTI